jgi:SAM-dependent methyltransferase
MSDENIYGHKKKLGYILSRIELYAKKHGKQNGEITILDAGCGNATAITYLLAVGGYSVIGVDFHSDSVEYARKHNLYRNLDLVCADINRYRPPHCFDVIVCADTLEHLYEPGHVLESLSKMLKPDGIIICSIPNGYGPFELERKVLDGLRLTTLILRAHAFYHRITRYKPVPVPDVPYNGESGHVQFYTYKKFEDMVKSSGLLVCERVNGSFFGAPISNIVLKHVKGFMEWNTRVSDRMPVWMVSTWYFTIRHY